MNVEIVSWTKPDDGWLKVVVRTDPLAISDAFYRVKAAEKGTWVWRKWSMAGTPSVPVSTADDDILNALVRDHPVLGLLCGFFGIAS